MAREKLIAEITGFDTEFFAVGLGNDTRLKQMPDYSLNDLALILQAATECKEAVILSPHPQSSFDRKDSSVIVRIDKTGKMVQNEWGSPRFGGVVYRASGTAIDGKIELGHVEFYPSGQESTLSLKDGKPLQIQSTTKINHYETTASYFRNPKNGELEFDNAMINFKRLSGSVSHEAFDDDELTISAVSPATYRFNGNWKKDAIIPADGSELFEVKPLPFQHKLAVKRITAENQVRIDISLAKNHEEGMLKKFDDKTTFSFSVLALSSKPKTPDSGTILIDLASIEAGQVSDLDDIATALLALAPAEIFDL